MKISKLYESTLTQYLLEQGSLKGLDGRCTGKSTGEALSAIGQAMQYPNKCITLSPEAKGIAVGILDLLKIEYMRVNTGLTYQPFMSDDDVHKELVGKVI